MKLLGLLVSLPLVVGAALIATFIAMIGDCDIEDQRDEEEDEDYQIFVGSDGSVWKLSGHAGSGVRLDEAHGLWDLGEKLW